MDAEARRLWRSVASTVRPLPGRTLPEPDIAAQPSSPLKSALFAAVPTPTRKPRPSSPPPPAPIEPNRRRAIERARPEGGAVLDLHGYDQDRARAVLTAFVLRAHAAGERAVLVVTGKGTMGDGVLRRRAPEWLAEPPLRPLVAGLSEAHRRHGGAGALYVALKRARA